MSKPRRVDANLVHAASLCLDADQCSIVANRKWLKHRSRRMPEALRDHALLGTHARRPVTIERLIDGHRAIEASGENRHIPFLDAAAFDGTLHHRRGGAILRDDKDATGFPVETKRHVGRLKPEVLARGSGETRPWPVLRRMAHQASGLVDHREPCVIFEYPRGELVAGNDPGVRNRGHA